MREDKSLVKKAVQKSKNILKDVIDTMDIPTMVAMLRQNHRKVHPILAKIVDTPNNEKSI